MQISDNYQPPRRAYFIVVVAMLAAATAMAQSAEEVVIKNPNGVVRIIPRIDAGYVDVEPVSGDLFPGLFPARIPLRNQVSPVVEAAIVAAKGWFSYHYILHNQKHAPQPIMNWSIVLSSREVAHRTEQPRLWHAGFIPSTIGTVRRLLDGAASGLILGWYAATDEAPLIPPGNDLGGFVLESDYQPGLVYAFVYSKWPDDSVLGRLPSEVVDKVTKYLWPEYTAQTRITVGPVFPASASLAEKLEHFLRRSRVLRAGVDTDVGEEFRLELLTRLEKARQSGLLQGQADLCQFAGRNYGMRSELEILRAIRLSVCMPPQDSPGGL